MTLKTRSFLAIDIEDDLKDKIAEIQDEIKKTDAQIKYVEVKNFHLTLKFFAEIDEDEIKEVELAVEDLIKNFKPFDLELKGVGTFPNMDYMKVVWVGINSKELLKLQKDLDKEFVNLGFKKEKNFSSHITLGRVKGGKNKNKLKEKIKTLKTVDLGKMRVDKLALKKSQLKSSGSVYSNLKVFNLMGD